MRYLFCGYSLDDEARELRRGDELLHAEPQIFDLLVHLLRNRDRVLSQDELLEAIWNGRFVSESTFRGGINTVRRLVGDDGKRQRLIRTFPRRGVRFIGEVEELDGDAPRTGDGQGALVENGSLAASRGGRPAVAILPFAYLGGDASRDHVADGLTEDITTALARHRGLLVVARNSSFAFKDHAGDVREVGRQLGADYVVEGSVRQSRDRLRVNAHLIETEGGRVMWADALEQRFEDLFDVLDTITARVAASIEPQIGTAERRRLVSAPRGDLRAWDLFQIGTRHLYRSSAQSNAEAQRLFRAAIGRDDTLAQAHALLAYAILLSILYFNAEPDDDRLEEALTLAQRGLEIDSHDAMIRFVFGRVLLARGRYQDALEELETAVTMNPALPISHCGVADSLAYEGRYEESFPHFQHAIELSPHDPQRWAFFAYRAMAHLFARQFNLAVDWAHKATRIPNCHYWPFSHRVAALGHLDRPDERAQAVKELVERRPGFSRAIARQRLFYIKDEAQLELYLDGLRKAGIPES